MESGVPLIDIRTKKGVVRNGSYYKKQSSNIFW